jgi:hypothetical protein
LPYLLYKTRGYKVAGLKTTCNQPATSNHLARRFPRRISIVPCCIQKPGREKVGARHAIFTDLFLIIARNI